MLNSGLLTWQELLSELNADAFLSVNGEGRLCVCVQTQPCRPLLGGDALQTRSKSLALFVPAWLGQMGFIAVEGEFLHTPSPGLLPL